MDYGPSLNATFEVSDNGSNIANKGIAIRLDAGQGGIAGQATLGRLRSRHDAPGRGLDRSGLYRLEWHQL